MRPPKTILQLFAVMAAVVPVILGQSAESGKNDYVHRSQAPPEHREMFRALGNRLEVKGSERLILTGTLTQPGRKNSTSTVQVIVNILGMLNLSGPGGDSVKFDGAQIQGNGGGGKADQDLIDAITGDGMEQFLRGQASGTGMRQIGRRVAMGTPRAYYDIYQTFERSGLSWKAPMQVKNYVFNSDTHLLAWVGYQPAGSNTQVVTKYSNWRTVNGQASPWTIERSENGVVVFTFQVSAAAVTPEANDGLFPKH